MYPGGVNVRPTGHDDDADRTARLTLLDAAGRADAVNGRIVLLTVGMSNTTQESQAFIPLAKADPQLNVGALRPSSVGDDRPADLS